jgi:polyribonucleotide nucleotidyltransferase
MHVSEIAHQRTANVRDVLSIGQTVNVKVLNVEEGGKIKLSMKALIENPNPDGGDRSSEGGANRDGDSGYRRPHGGGGSRGGDHRKNRF